MKNPKEIPSIPPERPVKNPEIIPAPDFPKPQPEKPKPPDEPVTVPVEPPEIIPPER